jgi:hypothetical protein
LPATALEESVTALHAVVAELVMLGVLGIAFTVTVAEPLNELEHDVIGFNVYG